MERCIVFCEKELASLQDGNFSRIELQGSLQRTLALSEAAYEVSTYILSWKSIEKSIHLNQSDSSGPLSQSTIKNFTELQSKALSHLFFFKCLLVTLVAGKDAVFDDDTLDDAHVLGQLQKNEETLLHHQLLQLGYSRSFLGRSTFSAIVDLLLYQKKNVIQGNQNNTVLSLLSYCLIGSGAATREELMQAMHMYLSVPPGDVLLWIIAVYIDLAPKDQRYLEEAKLFCQEDMVCGKIPIEYLQRFMSLGESPTALSLLYQKWIDPNIEADVLGCIQILLHNGLVLECYVQLKQYLRQLSKGTCQHKAKLYWQEMFASGSKYGLLFQLIRLPISINSEEEYVIDWFTHALQKDQCLTYVKAICLYFVVRGRIDEAFKHFTSIEINFESEWDVYLSQLMDLAAHFTVFQEPEDHRSSYFMLQSASNRDIPLPSGTRDLKQDKASLLFSSEPMNMDNRMFGASFDGEPLKVPLHGSKLRHNRSAKGAHALDKVLGLS